MVQQSFGHYEPKDKPGFELIDKVARKSFARNGYRVARGATWADWWK